jgi:hypothetical protein
MINHANPISVGTGLTIAGDTAIHQPGMFAAQRGIVQADLLHRPDLEILDQHVGGSDQLPGERLSTRVLEVERQAALVAVDAEIVGALTVQPGRSPLARIVAADGMLDLDHVGSQICKQHGAVWASQNP